jgi:hypothetical protein
MYVQPLGQGKAFLFITMVGFMILHHLVNEAQNFHNQEQNKEDALQRLKELILASVS